LEARNLCNGFAEDGGSLTQGPVKLLYL
jgi:hypothetical protein